MDLDHLIVAVTVVGALIRSLWNGRKIDKIHGEVKNGTDTEHRSLREVALSTESTTKAIAELHAYQQTRNHDLLAGVATLLARQYLVMLELTPELAERLGPPSLDKFRAGGDEISDELGRG